MTSSEQPLLLEELILAKLSGDISPEAEAALYDRLLQSEADRQFYVEYVQLNAILQRYAVMNAVGNSPDNMPPLRSSSPVTASSHDADHVDIAAVDDATVFREIIEQDLHDTAARQALKGEEAYRAELEKSLLESTRPIKPRFGRRELIGGLQRIAAIILIALAITWLDRMLYRSQTAKPAVLATIIDTLEAKWDADIPLKAGDSLKAGPLKLVEGYASLRMAKGAEVILQAPVELMLGNDNMIFLENGSLSAVVPPSARRFTVQTPGIEIVDFGTAFGVKTQRSSVTEVHVFEGRVRACLDDDQDNNNRQPLYQELAAGQAVQMDVVGKQVRDISMRQGMFVQQWNEARIYVQTEGQVVYQNNMPTLTINSFEHDEIIYLFPEQQNVTLSVDLSVEIPKISAAPTRRLIPAEIRRGVRVDSYLLHADLLCDTDGPVKQLQGRLRFNRPIVGLIHKGEHLIATDEILGRPLVLYETTVPGSRGAKQTGERFLLSEDRRTMDVTFMVRNMEEWRILTESSY